jgi:S1-C subfamily serine protease
MKPLLGALAVAVGTALPAPADEGIPAAVLADLKAATVLVKVRDGAAAGTGSGFLMQADKTTGLIVTNDHVVSIGKAGRPRRPVVHVVLHSGRQAERTVPAVVVATDPDRDLAVLRVTNVRDLPRPLDLTQEVKLAETMPVYVVGFPFGEALATSARNPAVTIGKGSVSSLREDDRGVLSVIQIDGDVNPGNSGGPVVDGKGRLVGVAVAKVRGTNIGLAVPARDLGEMLQGRLSGMSLSVGRVEGETAEVEVELRFIDPLKRIERASVLVTRSDKVQGPAAPGKDGQRPALPNAEVVQLTVGDQRATGKFKVESAGNKKVLYAVQPAYSREGAATVYAQPQPYLVDFTRPTAAEAETPEASKATPDTPRPPPKRVLQEPPPKADATPPPAASTAGPMSPPMTAALPGARPDGPSMFAVNAAPERFEGKTVGTVIRRGDLYELQAFNENQAKPDALTFRVSKVVANKLMELSLPAQYHPVRLTCRIEREGGRWAARVGKVEFIAGEQVTRTVADEDAADLLAVNANPAPYEGKTLVFDRVLVFGKPVKTANGYELRVSNEAKARPDDLPFVLPEKLAGEFVGLKLEDRRYPGRVTCWVERRGAGWQARVTQVEVDDQGRKRSVK